MKPSSKLHQRQSRTIRRKVLSIAITQAILGFSVAHAATIDVNSNLDGTDPNKCTLRDALTSANTDKATGGCAAGSGLDKITFEGLAKPATINLTEGVLTISTPMTIQGPGSDQLTLDAGGNSQLLNLNNGDFNTNIDVAIDGVTFTNGFNDYGNGGGVAVGHENLTLSNSTISNSSGNEGGGGLYLGRKANVDISSSVITGNTARFGGGGIDSRGSLKLSDSTVSNNELTSGSGGGISSSGGYISLQRSMLTGNLAQGTSRNGGGLDCNNRTEIQISDSQISSNTAPAGGGMSVGYACNISISSSTLSANVAGGTQIGEFGGAISANSNGKSGVDRFTLSLTNSTLSGNSANSIGAVYASGGLLYLDHVTISDNSAAVGSFGPVGGLRVSAGMHVSNSIMANNNGADCEGLSTSLETNQNNIIANGECSTGAVGLITSDPLLGPLQVNAGSTPTHALLAGSPALAAGDASACAARDQRGAKRSGGECDIGAFEKTQFVDTLADNETVDGLCSLREALKAINFESLVDSCVAGHRNDTILFDPDLLPGTLHLQGSRLRVYSSVEIQGPGAEQLTISGNLHSSILEISDESSNLNTVDISGLTLAAGSASYAGGAIVNKENLTVRSSVVTGNVAGYAGGGIFSQGSLTLNDSVVTGNTAGRGAGFYGQQATITINNSEISNNQATFAAGGYAFTGSVEINNSSFINNVGGGFAAGGTLTTIDQSTFSGNSAKLGAGINLRANNYGFSSSVIQNSTIAGNASQYYGGGIYSESDELTVSNTTFSGNFATRGGGGLAVTEGSVLLVNSTISANGVDPASLKKGSGIWVKSSEVTLGMANTIIANGTGAVACVNDTGANLYGSSYNLIDDGSCSGGAIGLITGNPLLGPLQDNGGPTLTHLPAADSPAVNAAGETFFGEEFDQRGAGYERVLGGQLDVGSVETGWQFGQISIDPASITVDEAAGVVNLTVIRSGGSDGSVSATVNTVSDSATAGLDFAAITDELVEFADGDAVSKAISVTLIDDEEIESNELFSVQLSNPTNHATLGNDVSAITIFQNDRPELIFSDGFETETP